MFSLDELASNIEACRNGRMSLDDFEDWFRDNSRGAYQSELKEVYFSVEEVFSKERRGMSEELVVEELAVAIRPFAKHIVFVDCEPQNVSQEWYRSGLVKKPLYRTASAIA